MNGYWVAKQDGREVARGSTAHEAFQLALMEGASREKVQVEYVYTSDRI